MFYNVLFPLDDLREIQSIVYRMVNTKRICLVNILYFRLFLQKRRDRQAKDETCDGCSWSSHPTPVSSSLLEWILGDMQSIIVFCL